MDENRLTTLSRQHGIKKAKDSDSIGKLFTAYLRRAEESVLGRVIVELTIVLSASRTNAAQALSEGAAVYKIDTEAIALEVKREFAAKQKANAEKKTTAKTVPAKGKKSA